MGNGTEPHGCQRPQRAASSCSRSTVYHQLTPPGSAPGLWMLHLPRNLTKTRTPPWWDASHQASRQISEAVAVWLVGLSTWGPAGPVIEAQQEPKEKEGSLASTFLPDLSFPRQLECSRHRRILSEVS